MRAIVVALSLALLLPLASCGYNRLQAADEQVAAAWSEVLNQYQRRADLVPNLVNTVRGAAGFEQSTLTAVIEARAKATAVPAGSAMVNDPTAFARYESAQAELSNALSRLMVVVERYPELRATSSFLELQAQLEGSENRIAVARRRYIDAVQAYNVLVRSFPVNLTAKVAGMPVKANFAVRDEGAIARPPTVDLGFSPAASAPSR